MIRNIYLNYIAISSLFLIFSCASTSRTTQTPTEEAKIIESEFSKVSFITNIQFEMFDERSAFKKGNSIFLKFGELSFYEIENYTNFRKVSSLPPKALKITLKQGKPFRQDQNQFESTNKIPSNDWKSEINLVTITKFTNHISLLKYSGFQISSAGCNDTDQNSILLSLSNTQIFKMNYLGNISWVFEESSSSEHYKFLVLSTWECTERATVAAIHLKK